MTAWGAASRALAWDEPGNYRVRARARCAADPAVLSAWSQGTTVTVTGPSLRLRRRLAR